jgi:ABC-type glycerol-3-phosphate transport system substrate-binding protein
LFNQGCAVWESERGQRADFTAGRVLFVIDSTAELPTLERAVAVDANFAWSIATLPHAGDEPVVSVHGRDVAILRTNPQGQLAAWIFIKWLAEPTQQARWARNQGCFPSRQSIVEQMDVYLEQHPHYQRAAQLLTLQWITEPRLTAYASCRAAIGRMLYAVTAGESVDEWLSTTQTQCNEALNTALQ